MLNKYIFLFSRFYRFCQNEYSLIITLMLEYSIWSFFSSTVFLCWLFITSVLNDWGELQPHQFSKISLSKYTFSLLLFLQTTHKVPCDYIEVQTIINTYFSQTKFFYEYSSNYFQFKLFIQRFHEKKFITQHFLGLRPRYLSSNIQVLTYLYQFDLYTGYKSN